MPKTLDGRHRNGAAMRPAIRCYHINYDSDSTAYVQPLSLQTLCIDVICVNYPALSRKVSQ